MMVSATKAVRPAAAPARGPVMRAPPGESAACPAVTAGEELSWATAGLGSGGCEKATLGTGVIVTVAVAVAVAVVVMVTVGAGVGVGVGLGAGGSVTVAVAVAGLTPLAVARSKRVTVMPGTARRGVRRMRIQTGRRDLARRISHLAR